MRRFFEFLAAGYALTEELPPPWHQANTPPISLFADLDEEKRDKITEYSQYAVRCIALGQLHKVTFSDKLKWRCFDKNVGFNSG